MIEIISECSPNVRNRARTAFQHYFGVRILVQYYVERSNVKICRPTMDARRSCLRIPTTASLVVWNDYTDA